MCTRHLILLLVGICTGVWAQAQQKAKIAAAQYFFDKDPGVTASKPLKVTTSDTSVVIADSISTASLKPGFHSLSIRVKNSAGKWSILESRSFYIVDSALMKQNITKITAAQYFFDVDPGIAASSPLNVAASDTTVNIADSISTALLKPGFHTMSIRVRNSTGSWSLYETRSFYISDSAAARPNIMKIAAAQYFFDKDPGISASKPLKVVTSDTAIRIADSVSTTSLKPGFHILSIRVKNSAGKWSIMETKSLYVTDTALRKPYITNITAAEYFFDKDPGAGKGKAIKVSTSDTAVNFNDSIPTGFLSGRNHTVTIRVKNKAGKWSFFESRNFSFAAANADRDGLLDYEEPPYGTDPTNFDTNGDYLADGVNVFTGLAALSTDTDGDGISNLQEIINGTSPILKDTDGDGVPDNKDKFPLDRSRSASPVKNAADNTPPVITLSEPI